MLTQNKVKYNNKLSEKQLEDKIDAINELINSDKLHAHYSILSSITTNLEDYLLNVYSPSFKNRKAEKLLLSEDYNNNMSEILNDINNAFSETEFIRQLLTTSYNRNNIVNSSIIDELKEVKKDVLEIEDYLDKPTLELVVGLEDFSDNINIDEEESNCHINHDKQMTSLARKNVINQNSNEAEITIKSESNGFLGNNHEIKIDESDRSLDETGSSDTGQETIAESGDGFSTFQKVTAGLIENSLNPIALTKNVGSAYINTVSSIGSSIAGFFGFGEDDEEPEEIEIPPLPPDNSGPHIKRIGEGNNRSDISKIQNDNLDTWFEYETCNIPDIIKEEICKGYGFEYSDGTVWAVDPSSPDYLLLSFKIKLPEAVRINYLDIIPYLPVNEVSGAKIKLVELFTEDSSSGDGNVIADENDNIILGDSEGAGTFHFNPTQVKEIVIKLMKEEPYEADIGHKFFIRDKTTETTTNERKVIFRSEETEVVNKRYRVEGDIGTNPGQFKQSGSSGIFSSEEKESRVTKDEVISGLEYFYGDRWCIGVKNVGVYSFIYENQSTLVSEEFISPGSIKKIKLEAQEYVPDIFFEDGKNGYNNLKYYISIDDGSQWHEIIPNDSNRTGIEEYHINNINAEEVSKDYIKNLSTDNEVNRVKVKIEFANDNSIEMSEYYSPILRGYKLEMYSDMG